MHKSENVTGALFMMASMAAFTLNDALLKSMAGSVPLFQLLFLRGLYTVGFVGLLAWRTGALSVRPSAADLRMMGLRALAEAGAAYFFLTALFHMPLANVTAILQASPLLITLAASLIFGEQIGWRRLLAIVAGFAGVMLIVRPGTSDFSVFSLYALVAVLCVTVRDLSTRRISRATPSFLVTLVTASVVTAFFALLTAGEDWQPLSLPQHARILLVSIFVIGGYVFSVMGMRIGEVSFTAPFRYTGLLWALVLGYVVFGEWPEPLTLIGAAIVVGSGIFMLYREARLGLLSRKHRRAGVVVRPR